MQRADLKDWAAFLRCPLVSPVWMVLPFNGMLASTMRNRRQAQIWTTSICIDVAAIPQAGISEQACQLPGYQEAESPGCWKRTASGGAGRMGSGVARAAEGWWNSRIN